MTLVGRAADALLEASVIGSFSRVGLAARSRLLPEFTADDRPPFAGKVAIITGATSGLGQAAAIDLVRLGGTVYFLARDRVRAAEAQRQIATAADGAGHVSYGIGDLEDLASVRAFADEFRAAHDRLDVLIHAAGAIRQEYRTNAAGVELTVAGQVVAPFLLTSVLLAPLEAAAPSRVIFVSSGGMYSQRLDLDLLQPRPAGYRGVTQYARVKRAQVALSREWAGRLAATGVACHAMHPGWADTPGLAAALPGFHRVMRPLLRSPQQGADTIVWLATADAARLGSGQFWHDRRPRPEYRLRWTRERDAGTAARLWQRVAALAQVARAPGPAAARP